MIRIIILGFLPLWSKSYQKAHRARTWSKNWIFIWSAMSRNIGLLIHLKRKKSFIIFRIMRSYKPPFANRPKLQGPFFLKGFLWSSKAYFVEVPVGATHIFGQ